MKEQLKSQILNKNLTEEELDLILDSYAILEKPEGFKNNTELLQLYLKDKTMQGLSTQTLYNYSLILNSFFQFLNDLPLYTITARHIKNFLFSYQAKKSCSLRTIDKYRQYINSFFHWCVDEGYLEKSPGAQIHPIKYDIKSRSGLTQLELEWLREACSTDRDRALIEFLYSTGARVSEVAEVKKSDINWQEKTVHLFGKGRKHRTSFLNAKSEVALTKYLSSRQDNNDYLFVSIKKPYNKLKKDAIEKIIRNISIRAFEKIGRKITPHILRHTTATTALQNGMPIEDISKLLGHENIETTMIYAKTSLEEVQSAHKKYIV